MPELLHNMPQELPKQVHDALRAWRSSRRFEEWQELLLLREHSKEGGAGAYQTLLSGALDRLSTVNPDAATLLRRRFEDGEIAHQVAQDMGTTEDMVYQTQREAIAQLAAIIWAQELEARHRRAETIALRLDPASYSRLFGIEDAMAGLKKRLLSDDAPWILTLEGMGGVGKTSLADALVRKLSYQTYFHEIAWISVRTSFFSLSRMSPVAQPQPPGLLMEQLSDHLIEQFDLKALRHQNEEERRVGMRAYLRTHRCLVVVDNLETEDNYRSLVPQLRSLTRPSKFLLTTRYSLQGESGVYVHRLDGLSPQDTLALIRYEAQAQGLDELAHAPDRELLAIYKLTGGNPLATKLIIGQVHTFPLPEILERFRSATLSNSQQLLNFIYAEAWASLDPTARKVLQAMLFIPEAGGRLEQIIAASGLEERQVLSELRDLVSLSLVNTRGNLHERLYSLHPLTRAFLASLPGNRLL